MYKTLDRGQIDALHQRGCSAESWDSVYFEDFDPECYSGVHFSGEVRVASQQGGGSRVVLEEGVEFRAGIYGARIHNCEIGRGCYISGVREYVSGYRIGSGVVISGVNSLSTRSGDRFGNGVRVSVLNEAGGREVAIYDELSSQIAYLMAMYRDSSRMVEVLEGYIDRYADQRQIEGGYVGDGAVIRGCGDIRGVNIGQGAQLLGASLLENGSVNSSFGARTVIGRGVIARDFIVASSGSVTDGAMIDRCFVGQGTEISKGFSAENSLFFSNCIAINGEACAVFAGPYTVTHHKSTLLIGGLFSFMNAGSGSNQSNHMYKFGPVHQGIVERGTKLASDSYILWPMRVGAFSLVIGKHYSNVDTSKLPFSYIIEKEYGEPVIIPGANLRSIGVIRDIGKWPGRDKRGDGQRLDLINFTLLTPYIVGKIISGLELLTDIVEIGGSGASEYVYGGCTIKRHYVERGIEFYQAAITKFLGEALISRLSVQSWSTLEEMRALLHPRSEVGSGEWVDISGVVIPRSEQKHMVSAIEDGKLGSLSEVSAEFERIGANYDEHLWRWALPILEQRLGCSVCEARCSHIEPLIRAYMVAVQEINDGVCKDAQKEFGERIRTGFGIDGDDLAQRDADFSAVRGSLESNPSIEAVHQHTAHKLSTAESLVQRLKEL